MGNAIARQTHHPRHLGGENAFVCLMHVLKHWGGVQNSGRPSPELGVKRRMMEGRTKQRRWIRAQANGQPPKPKIRTGLQMLSTPIASTSSAYRLMDCD